jgi:hypothetical protein
MLILSLKIIFWESCFQTANGFKNQSKNVGLQERGQKIALSSFICFDSQDHEPRNTRFSVSADTGYVKVLADLLYPDQ